MAAVSNILVNEPGRLSLGVTTKALWSSFVIGYKNKDLLDKLSETIEFEHTNLQMQDVVSTFKAFAYFDYLNLPARDGLVK